MSESGPEAVAKRDHAGPALMPDQNSMSSTDDAPFGRSPREWVFVEPAHQSRIEQFYAMESHLLDDRRFREWLELFAGDIHYWMPIRRTMPPRQRDLEFTGPGELAQFDETKAELEQRVMKIETGKAWAEEPPSRTRHLVTGIRAVRVDDGWEVRSNILVYQSRSERIEHTFVGERRDRLVDAPDGPLGLLIARREIRLDHSVLTAPSLSIFF